MTLSAFIEADLVGVRAYHVDVGSQQKLVLDNRPIFGAKMEILLSVNAEFSVRGFW